MLIDMLLMNSLPPTMKIKPLILYVTCHTIFIKVDLKLSPDPLLTQKKHPACNSSS